MPNDNAPDPAPIRDAATVIVLRRMPAGPAVLMGMRGEKAAFMPSKYVFPGGAVDATDAGETLAGGIDAKSDARLAQFPHSDASAHALATAALRELSEETGLVIGRAGSGSGIAAYAQAGLLPDASALHFIFRAITPPGRSRRFDARFFLVEAEALSCDPDDFSRACDELSHLHWVPLDQARALDLPFITDVVLAEVGRLLTGGTRVAAPPTVPFFDNSGPEPRFRQIA
ncbi:NUDIX hydrolase [Paracoccus pacificus]|uniref:DNA mismatch repair protein MutT n=1 Tax=Paracoccus pacificus TaxID=1463598 RepID=A0ABW4R520_9RHOB